MNFFWFLESDACLDAGGTISFLSFECIVSETEEYVPLFFRDSIYFVGVLVIFISVLSTYLVTKFGGMFAKIFKKMF